MRSSPTTPTSSKAILLTAALCLAIFSLGRSETGNTGLSSEGQSAETGDVSPPLIDSTRLLATVTLQVSSSGGESTHDTLTLRAGQSPLAAAFDFVQKHNVNVQEIVSLSKSLEQDLERRHGAGFLPPAAGSGAHSVPEERFAELGVEAFPKLQGEEEHALRAADLMDQGLFKEAAIHFALAAELVPEPTASVVVDGGAEEGLGDDEKSAQAAVIEAAATLRRQRVNEYHSSATSIVSLLRALAKQETEIAELIAAEKWIVAMNALEELKRAGGPLAERSAFFSHQDAIVHLALGNFTRASRKCGEVLRRVSHRGSWRVGQPRSHCVEIGASASLALGDVKAAKNFLSVALRADPDSYLAANFSAVKKLDRHLKAIDKALDKGYNHDVLEKIEVAQAALALMDSPSDLIHAKLLTKACTAQGRMKRFEDAIESCEQAYELYQGARVLRGTFALVEVLKERANVYQLDNDHDEAAHDYREILSIYEAQGVDQATQSEATRQWRHAQQQKTLWENPARRDHKQVLDLPVNLHELNKQSQCKWIKKQHKAMVKKWHPDKAKGDKRRAARKFEEVSDAKKFLWKQFRCS